MDEIWPEKDFGMHCLDVVAQVRQVDLVKNKITLYEIRQILLKWMRRSPPA